jgi:penicillin-binding protein 1A
MLQQVLEATVQHGTGAAARLESRPAAGTTGTTQDHADAWFVGCTPQLAAVVWMGVPDARVPTFDAAGEPITGGGAPAALWHDLFSRHYPGPATGFCQAPEPRPGHALGAPADRPRPTQPTRPTQPIAPTGTPVAPGVVLVCAPGLRSEVDLERGIVACVPA